MKRILITMFLLVSVLSVAQTPQQILREYKVPQKFLNDLFEERYLEKYAYKIKIEDTDKENKKREKVLSYDPTRGSGAKWKLVSVNGAAPNADQLKEETQMNAQEGRASTQKGDLVDESKIKIVSQNENQIVLSFNFNENALPSSFSFLADNVPGLIYLNKADKTLSRILIKSAEPFRVKVVAKIEQFILDIRYKSEQQQKIYVPQTENLKLKMSAMGMDIAQNNMQEYFDYKLVKAD